MYRNYNFQETKTLVDEYIVALLDRRKSEARDISEAYEAFWSRVADVAMHGGKRFRPYLAMVGYGCVDEKVVPIATAQEFIHIAMLMHDDIIDQDDIRHGKKNINGIYKNIYRKYLEPSRAQHYAYGAGILAGDALISEAYRLIYTSEFDETTKQKLAEQLFVSIYEVIGGELMDVEAAFVTDTMFDPLQIYRYKTSSYSLIGPLLSGAHCAGANQETIDILKSFAINVGIGYQIQDDLLGVFGDESETGKSTLTDLREGKRTLLVAFHETSMDTEAAKHFRAFGKEDASNEQLSAIKNDMVSSGAKDKSAEQVEKYFEKAVRQLERLPSSEQRSELESFTQQLRGRKH